MIVEVEFVGGYFDGLTSHCSPLAERICKIHPSVAVAYDYVRTDEVRNGRRVYRCDARIVNPSVIKSNN